MLSIIALSTALLCTLTSAAPTPAATSTTTTSTTASLSPLYCNGVNLSGTTFSAANITNPTKPNPTQAPTAPNPFTVISAAINVTITRQDAAAPLFHIPSQDAQLFAAFADAAYAQQNASKQPADALPNDKLDIGAKLVGEEGGDHTVHITVLTDPRNPGKTFTWAEGTAVVDALQQWAALWAAGSFVPCAGVTVENGGDVIAEGSFCGTEIS